MSKQKRALRDFLENQGSPIVFKLPSEWPCRGMSLEEWAGIIPDELIFRNASRTNAPTLESDTRKIKATLREFDALIQAGKCERMGVDLTGEWLYSSYNWMSSLRIRKKDCLNWEFFDENEKDCSSTTIWFGTAGAFTPCHRDAYGLNLVVQLIGHKEWTLFAPGDGYYLYQDRLPYEETSIFSRIDLNQPIDLERWPEFSKAKPFRVVLGPGDVLLIPKHWWHFVKCLDVSVSVNRWFELPSDTDDRVDESLCALLASRFRPFIQFNEQFRDIETGMICSIIRQSLAQKAAHAVTERPSPDDDTRKSIIDAFGIREVEEFPGLATIRKRKRRKPPEISDAEILSSIFDPEVIALARQKIQMKMGLMNCKDELIPDFANSTGHE